MKICEYENYSCGELHVDYANDLFLDFAFENAAVAAADYDLMLRKERVKQRKKNGTQYKYASYREYCDAMGFSPN